MSEVVNAVTEAEVTPVTEPVTEKTFSQAEVDAMIAKRVARVDNKAKKEFEESEQYKGFLAWQDSQKTEQQKVDDKIKQYKDSYKTLKGDYDNVSNQLQCIKLGVKEDCVGDVVALAKNYINDETDLASAIKGVIEKYPQFSNKVEDVKPFQVQPKTTSHGSNIEDDPFLQGFNKK